jgi:hypothetical protein
LNVEVDEKKVKFLKLQFHELVEAENKEFGKNEKELERLKKDMHVVLK